VRSVVPVVTHAWSVPGALPKRTSSEVEGGKPQGQFEKESQSVSFGFPPLHWTAQNGGCGINCANAEVERARASPHAASMLTQFLGLQRDGGGGVIA